MLRAAAKYWVKVDEAELKKIAQICGRLSPKTKGLTEKNRRRLMPFNDPETVRRFLDLPSQLASNVRASNTKNVVNAVSAQIAVALAILQAVPIRVGNLAALDLGEHIIESAGKIYVLIDGHEVKNDLPYQMELSKEAADLLAWYCLEHRELLLDQPSTALFPGENGRPKLASTLGRQITERCKRNLGLAINPHLFRHIAAKLYLDRRPGEYALVSRLLNHKSVTTTMRAYTGTETISAGRHFQMLVDGLRSKNKPYATKRRKVRL